VSRARAPRVFDGRIRAAWARIPRAPGEARVARGSDDAGDDSVDHYTTERLRAADTLVLSGRTSFQGHKAYWTSVRHDPNATASRREFADLIARVDKVCRWTPAAGKG
jgi:hypothetical protein